MNDKLFRWYAIALSCVLVIVYILAKQQAIPPMVEIATPTPPPAKPEPIAHSGDLEEIKKNGELRIIVPANMHGIRYLPRKGSPVQHQQQLAEAFAQSQGLKPVFIPVHNFRDMMPSLIKGDGDLIVANLTVNEKRKEMINFSVPLTHVREQVIVKADNNDITKAAELNGKSIMVDPASSFWQRIQTLKGKYPDIKVVKRPKGIDDEWELDMVVSGRVDAVIRDSNVADMYLGYRDDLKVAFSLPGVSDIAWGLRKNSLKLKSALNRYLHLEHNPDEETVAYKDDLDGIKRRKRLRILLRNNASSYFLYRGELMGFEYEMARTFAEKHKLRLEVIVPHNHQQMLEWLKEGKADLAAGFLEPLDSRREMGLEFSRPYHYAYRHIVVAENSSIHSMNDLQGKTIHIRRSSSSWPLLQQFNKEHGNQFTIKAVAEDTETETLIQQVANGEIEATVADGHLLDIELSSGVPVRSARVIGNEKSSAVAIRKNNPKLLKALNKFIKKSYRGLYYNVLYTKYFKNSRTIKRIAQERQKKIKGGKLSPYDPITQRYSEHYGFDWRLVTAQMYQESKFNPKAVSFAGARGLMQVMPKTAKSMGFAVSDLEKPGISIHAGVKYLDWVRNRFESELPFSERLWFTLASYNAGIGHVFDARKLAKQKGWDPDKWFDNVERAMLLLSQKKYSRKAKYGFVRGREPVHYVNGIRERFKAYVKVTEQKIAMSPSPTGLPIADEIPAPTLH